MTREELSRTSIKNHFKKYPKAGLAILSVPLCLCNSLSTKDFWTILFISCLALFAPILWSGLAFFLCYKIYCQLYQNNLSQIENVQYCVVQSVQMNRLEELSKVIDENPGVLYCDYQRRSLVAWCRYYKNTKAQELVIKMMKKYPREQMAA